MYTSEAIKLQNQQDVFSAMFLFISREILKYCGERSGEGVIREAVRRVGCKRGAIQRIQLQNAHVKANLQSLNRFHRNCTADPRCRCKTLWDQEDRQNWEIHTCPLADYWRANRAEKLGSFFCEEYQLNRFLAYTEDIGQLNLSKMLTCPRDNFCCFSAYYREANMSSEKALEVFTSNGSSKGSDAGEMISVSEDIHEMTVLMFYYLYEVAKERFDMEGGCAVAHGLRRWQIQTKEFLAAKADAVLQKMDIQFLEENFPLPVDSSTDMLWKTYCTEEARQLMQRLVLTPLWKEGECA